MAKVKNYDVMVRVNFTWVNEHGDERQNWVVNIGNWSSNDPDALPAFIAENHIKLEPVNGEEIHRILHTEIACYTIVEEINV